MSDCTLYLFGDDPFSHHYTDHEGRVAFTISEANRSPNLITRLTREKAWSQLHPTIMGPENSFYYFGPQMSQGVLAYGNNQGIPMGFFRDQKKADCLYFRAQNRKEYKWKVVNTHRMELLDGRNLLAEFAISPPGESYYASIKLRASCMPIVTEILTTLTLNRMASELGW